MTATAERATTQLVPSYVMGSWWTPEQVGKAADVFDASTGETLFPVSYTHLDVYKRQAQSYPALARQVAATYPIGNHSMSHPEFPTLSDAQVRAQLDDARAAIVTASGQDPRPYFRFPSGAVDARTIRLVNDRCYVPFRWTTDTLGWQGTSGGRSAASVATRVLDQARPGGIVLMHVGSHPQDLSLIHI